MLIRCIYCKEDKSELSYTKAEHVLPQSFGRFSDNITLHQVVCDDCNQHFGDHLELYLARDTPDGLNRFRHGLLPAARYKSLGKRSTLSFRIDSGPLAGALATQQCVDETLITNPLPQIGFGKSERGPYRWFRVDELPTVEYLRVLVEEGYHHTHFCEVDDPGMIIAHLQSLGAQTSALIQTRPANWRGRGRVGVRAILGHTFGRAITKIALNYLASQYGAATVLMPQFDEARRFVREAVPPATRLWDADETKIITNYPRAFGHIITVAWQEDTETVLAQVSFHNWMRYKIRLASGGFVLTAPFKGTGHLFDLRSMSVIPLRPAW